MHGCRRGRRSCCVARKEAGQELVLRAPAAEVVRTLTIAGLTDTLPIDLADRPDG
jgi:hypothetical protein